MAKSITLAKISLLFLSISVVSRRNEVAEAKTCVEVLIESHCIISNEPCIKICLDQFGPKSSGHCSFPLCVCSYECTEYD
ncbi:hypothetical protein HN51_053486 [Arachis hypogaea]|uniref:Knottin scorpion toxin-like domain-containing protein n=1 Tax=Arachis hypogaea TaxID=3818 RepID=A0A6B9V491_ARAHY|nr:uncharacterized protein DS421_19g638740 [Arachis hypogaea]